MHDELQLQRFFEAQHKIYDTAVRMLRGGTMCTPHIDCISPRLAGCDPPDLANPFGIASLDEARAYLANGLLGGRYRECVHALEWLSDMPAAEVFGEVDTWKLHASLTLFAEASNEVLLRTMLAVWYDNMVDEGTIVRLDLAA